MCVYYTCLKVEERKIHNAIMSDDITTIEQMILQDGIDVNAVILVSVIITINISYMFTCYNCVLASNTITNIISLTYHSDDVLENN